MKVIANFEWILLYVYGIFGYTESAKVFYRCISIIFELATNFTEVPKPGLDDEWRLSKTRLKQLV